MFASYVGKWLSIDLMGHQRIIGVVTGVEGTVIEVTSPAIPGDESHDALESAAAIVNLAGPALHHASVVTDAEGLSALSARRPRIYRSRLLLTDEQEEGPDDDEIPY